MGRPKAYLEDSTDVRRYLTRLLVLVEKGEMPIAKAKALQAIACSIQNSIYGQLKEKELAQAEELAEQIKKANGGK